MEARRRTPEELLRDCQTEENRSHKGHLKIVLGYASGVGKTFRMLDEARRRRERGQDVVVGAIQPNVPVEAEPILTQLEVIAPKNNAMDVDAILARHPAVCFVDGLAYDNPLSARNAARWQDVEELVNAGIKVIGSINVQYVAELRNQIEAITSKHVTQTVPISFIKSASEIEVVDAPPEETQQQQLSKLREIALILAADVVEEQLNAYLEEHGMIHQFGAHERILVCITPRANVELMVETARLIADRFHGEMMVAYVKQAHISTSDQSALDIRLAIANAAGAHIEILEGDDPAGTLLQFARQHGVTQVFIGHSQRQGLSRIFSSPIDKLIRDSRGMDVRVFPH